MRSTALPLSPARVRFSSMGCAMAFRYMQIFVPQDADAKLDELLDGYEPLYTWHDGQGGSLRAIHLLVPADAAEPIMDRFEEVYGQSEGFHLVLLPVEAALPRLESQEDDGEAEQECDEAEEAPATQPGRVSREELYNEIVDMLTIDRVFLAMTLLSAVVAAVGLLRDDVAVIIGAMVIAPLLGPNVALAFSTTLGDLDLLRRALLTNVAGSALALGASLAIGLVMPIDASVPAIAARTQLGYADLVLALAAGSAGTFAITRGLSGAVIGVMVAVALMPPLVVFGMLVGDGQFSGALGALLLLSANVLGVNLAGVATFLVQGVRPRSWWEEERAKKARRIALAIWLVLLAGLSTILYFTHRPAL